MSVEKTIIRKTKKLLTPEIIDRCLAQLSKGKTFDNFFVKLLPSNLDYKKDAIRRKNIDGITYDLYLNQWMEYALYFGIANENKKPLYDLIKPGLRVIDVGVNFGETLLNFAQLLGVDGKVYGFEPMPYIYEKCLHNVSLNKFENIIIENAALSDNNENLIINDPANGNSGGTFVSKADVNRLSEIVIKVATLDEYIAENEIKKVDVIKIDVEGFETNVIKGALKTLRRDKPAMFIEVCDENLKRGNSSAIELIQLLEALDYKLTQPLTGMKITSGNINEFSHTDVLCI